MLMQEQSQPNRRRIIGVLLNLLGWGGSIFFLLLIWKQASVVDWSLKEIDWGSFVIAFVLFLIALALQSRLAWITQYYLNYPIDHFTIYRVWFFSQVARYIPGSLWQVAARSMFYVRRGIPLGVASAATLWELIATVAGSLILCIFSLSAISNGYLFSLGALALVFLSVIFYMIWPWKILLFFRIGLARRMIDALTQLGDRRYRMVLNLMLTSAAVWLIMGSGFYFFALAYGATHNLSWWTAVISFNIAYSVGFLVIIAPTGLGVREGILSVLLASYFSAPRLAMFVLLFRFCWIAAEAVHLVIAGIGQAVIQRRQVKDAILRSHTEVS